MGRMKKAQGGDTLSRRELAALAHQKRGMGELDRRFVKKSGPVMNEIGYLTDYQMKQLKNYMKEASPARKVYEGLPNVGRVFGRSAADIPKGSKLEKQKRGGNIKKAKTGKLVPKKSSVSKKLGSAKKSVGNMRFTKKKK